MTELDEDIRRGAERAAAIARKRDGSILDYSESSLTLVEKIGGEASQYASESLVDQAQNLARNLGCYVLEVGRRTCGGAYRWARDRNAPVLSR